MRQHLSQHFNNYLGALSSQNLEENHQFHKFVLQKNTNETFIHHHFNLVIINGFFAK